MKNSMFRNRKKAFNTAWPGSKFWKGAKTMALSPYLTYPAVSVNVY